MAFKPSDKRAKAPESVDPDVTPIMNLMIVLIPVLLSVAEFVQLALLEYSPPPIEAGAGEGGGDSEDETPPEEALPKLNLTLNITEEGFNVSLFGATSEGENFLSIPKDEALGSYNFTALRDELVRIRTEIIGKPIDEKTEIDELTGEEKKSLTFRYDDAEMLRIAAMGDVPWEVLVAVLDTSRSFQDSDGSLKPLFQLPVLGQVQ